MKYKGRSKWVKDLIKMMHLNGGAAHLSELDDMIKKIADQEGRALTAKYNATMRDALERHCVYSTKFKGLEVFIHPGFTDDGYYVLASGY